MASDIYGLIATGFGFKISYTNLHRYWNFTGRVQGRYVTVTMHDALPYSLIGLESISLKIWKQNQYIFDLDL